MMRVSCTLGEKEWRCLRTAKRLPFPMDLLVSWMEQHWHNFAYLNHNLEVYNLLFDWRIQLKKPQFPRLQLVQGSLITFLVLHLHPVLGKYAHEEQNKVPSQALFGLGTNMASAEVRDAEAIKMHCLSPFFSLFSRRNMPITSRRWHPSSRGPMSLESTMKWSTVDSTHLLSKPFAWRSCLSGCCMPPGV